MAAAMIGILSLMIVPIPPVVLDLMLSLSITASVVVLMVALYTSRPLDFSVFPGLLLVLTLFRLSVNVASTRLILGTANAGEVVRAFGGFVVQGNTVVGLVIFLILVVIQFVVITKGAGRIAEVAARFTLDAMPGKQMAIDADLNAGLIDETSARERRKQVASEADFYGAMDGASKFVRGDAIAGIIITLINILGGFVIGVVQMRMSVVESIGVYTVLTVGDGLVSQIPALLISSAAGIIVTRAGTEENLGRDLALQILAQPRALVPAATVLVILALIPGLPTAPFLILAAVVGVIAWSGTREPAPAPPEPKVETAANENDGLEELLRVEPMELEIGYGLIPLVGMNEDGDLLARIKLIRRQFASDLGLVVPLIRIRDNMQIGTQDYVVRIRGHEVERGSVLVGHLLALNTGIAHGEIDGVETQDPVFGLPAWWITESSRNRAEALGYTVIEAGAVIATHLTEVIHGRASELLGRQELHGLIDTLSRDAPALVQDLIPEPVNHGLLLQVLRTLLAERVPIRDLAAVLEACADAAAAGRDVTAVTEHVRQRLGPTITARLLDPEDKLCVLTLVPPLEQKLAGSLKDLPGGISLLLDPNAAAALARAVATSTEGVISPGNPPIILTSGMLRAPLRRFLLPILPGVTVLSYLEIPPSTDVKSIGTIELEQALVNAPDEAPCVS